MPLVEKRQIAAGWPGCGRERGGEFHPKAITVAAADRPFYAGVRRRQLNLEGIAGLQVDSGAQGQAAFADFSEPPRDKDFGLSIPQNHKDLQIDRLSWPTARISGGGCHSERNVTMRTHVFGPVCNGPGERRRLRKWLYGTIFSVVILSETNRFACESVCAVEGPLHGRGLVSLEGSFDSAERSRSELSTSLRMTNDYLNNNPLNSARFRRQTIHTCPPGVSMPVFLTPSESSHARTFRLAAIRPSSVPHEIHSTRSF